MKRNARPTVAGIITAKTANGVELDGLWYHYAPDWWPGPGYDP
jgi:hypothetical protein